MEISNPIDAVPARVSPGLPRRRVLLRLWRLIAAWRARMRGRSEVAQFDERMHRDLGIDPVRVWQETRKWFWQP